MAKKLNRVSKLSDKDEEFLKKGSLKERKVAANGKPDYSDYYNLQILFDLYDKTTGGKLKRFVNDLKVERALNGKLTMKKADASENLAFALPQDLQLFMEKYYPSIWTNQSHARWFLGKFPEFRR